MLKAHARVIIGLVALSFAAGFVQIARAQEPRQIEITAKKYSYDPSEITLKKGETVVLVFTSVDATHGIEIKALGVKMELHKGKPMKATVTPTQVGEFTGKCSHFCGRGHGSMTLKVNVTE